MLIDAFGQDLSALGIEDAGVVEVFADVHANDEVIGHGCVPPSDELEVVRLPSFSGHPICADLVSVGEDVHCESTAQEVHAGVPA